ncbi:hypothetical protein [Methylobacterium phyllostachyos]|nr:hypothetical protein [Methylobacterium phyllostachyos]
MAASTTMNLAPGQGAGKPLDAAAGGLKALMGKGFPAQGLSI